MKFFGIDPGTAITGFGVVEKNKLGDFRALAYGCIKTSAGAKPADRLGKIHAEITKKIKEFKPGTLALEDIFFFKNQKTALKVAQAQGITILIASQTNLPLYFYTPLQVKQAVCGYGRAEKHQVQKMVKTLLGLQKIPEPDDAADALAIAYCCAIISTSRLKTK